jgi:uncharacterized membrane protein YczE
MGDRAALLLMIVVIAMLLSLWNWLTDLLSTPSSPWASLAVFTMTVTAGLTIYVKTRRS